MTSEFVHLQRKSKPTLTPAVQFARQYASLKGIQKTELRKLVFYKELQKYGFDSILDLLAYQVQREAHRYQYCQQKMENQQEQKYTPLLNETHFGTEKNRLGNEGCRSPVF